MKAISSSPLNKARVFLAFFSWLISLGFLSTAQAAELAVTPLRIEFQAGKTGDALTVKNHGRSVVTIQPTLLKWEQKADGSDQLTPSRDVLVAPALVEIQPGESQVVRLALRRPPDPAQQLTYRVILREVPKAETQGKNQINILVNLSLPVFVAPTAPAQAAKFDASASPDGARLVFKNPTNSHVQIKEFSIDDGSGASAKVSSMFYLLAGQQRIMTLPPAPKLRPGPWQIQAKTDKGDLTVTSTVSNSP